jgi:hypothetical protein
MFRTELTPQIADFQINLQTPIFSMGSCFADTIGNLLKINKLQVLTNPFGVIFNPHSIFKLIDLSLNNQGLNADNFIQQQDLWYHYDLHSDWVAKSPEILAQNLDNQLFIINQFLQKAQVIILTFGTAWVYQRLDNAQIVANCHKQPAHLFQKKLLTVEEIVAEFGLLYQTLKKYNPKVNFILTVSPVRHLKDTLELNSVSKSVLRLASHQICSQLTDIQYFPSYEILLDDLRDYRFYGADMLHPSQVAEAYIWQKFTQTYFTPATLDFLKEWEKLAKALNHKSFQPNSLAHQKFLEATLQKLQAMAHLVEVEAEIQALQAQLKNE